ncbi:hypothetical protein GCM10007392_24860 [Saccharospirillum salsuginis]|uniref:Ice-binding protein C-terminal domain-containing protein n=2 Tax=Saccharospirillum salsuginis TaxID=418750 RepID=A0A918KB38_9GAMM|nr:hypothetical protein GCM10007392_24860 [Saccharospirillum salsuginis]
MKRYLFVLVSFVLGSAAAIPVDVTDFSGTAIHYGFDGDVVGSTTAGDGNAWFSNGEVSSYWTYPDFSAPIYRDGSDSLAIRVDFLAPVSALGMNFTSTHTNTSLSLYNSSGALLESYTMSTYDMDGCPDELFNYPCDFIGVDYGLNDVSYAIIDTESDSDDLWVDNLIYQSVPSLAMVSEPSTLGILVLGLAGLVVARRKRMSPL